MTEVVAWRCKTCNEKVDRHGCSEHRQATGHENFDPILEEELK